MPLTAEEKTKFDELLAKAEAGDLGSGYVPQATLTSRLKKQKEGHATAIGEKDEALVALQSQTDADAVELKAFRDKDKSAVQLRDDEFAAETLRFDAQKALTEKATLRGDALYAKNREGFIRSAVGKLIKDSGLSPARADTAIREAMAENKFSAVDPDGTGDFSLQMTVAGLVVDDNADAFGTWYKPRTDLHAKSGTVIPSPGAGTPPGAPPAKDRMAGLTPSQQFVLGMGQEGTT